MPRLCVVYDANAYRGLSHARLDAIRSLERSCGIVAYATYAVVTELASHLASQDDPHLASSWQALRRLASHCVRYDGSRSLIAFLADAEDQLCATLFGRALPDRAWQPEEYGELVQTIAAAETPAGFASHADFLANLAREVARQEAEWVDLVWRDLITRFVPEATSWQAIQRDAPLRKRLVHFLDSREALHVHAESMVARAASALSYHVPDSERAMLTDVALDAFRIPLQLFLTLLRRIVQEGYDLSKRAHANTLWDLQIAHCVSPVGRIEGSPIWLVTGDKMISQAVADSSAELLVWSLSDYQDLLGNPAELCGEIKKSKDLTWDLEP